MVGSATHKKIVACFDSLGADVTSPTVVSGWYALLNQVHTDLENPTEITFVQYLTPTQLSFLVQKYHLSLGVALDILIRQSHKIFELYCLLLERDLLLNDTVFFDSLSPNLVADWYTFRKLVKNRVHMLVTLHTIIIAAGSELGTPGIISHPNPNDVFNAHSDLYRSFGLDAFSFLDIWESVHFHKIPRVLSPKTSTTHLKLIKKAISLYRENRIPLTQFMTDLLASRKSSDPQHLITSHSVDSQSKQAERGMSEIEKALAQSLYLLKNTPISDIIQEAFYTHQNRDDACFECSFLMDELRNMQATNDHPVIVNPSPSFIKVFCDYNRDQLLGRVKFVVEDKTIRDLYQYECEPYGRFSFLTRQDLQNSPDFQTGLLVMMARDNLNLTNIPEIYNICADGAKILALVPQKSLNGSSNLFEHFAKNNLYIQKLITVPSAMVNSSPKKKVLLYAKKGAAFACDHVQLLFSTLGDAGGQLFTGNQHYPVPPTWFGRRTLQQIKKDIDSKNSHAAARESAKAISFSKEIHIHYVLLERQNRKYSARAVYRKILREKEYRKFGMVLTHATEKGLRSDSEEEVLRKLISLVPFYDDFAQVIRQDILDFYKCELDGVTYKTLWYCCRPDLLQQVTYDDDLCKMLFCGHCHALADLVVADYPPEEITAAMKQLITESGKSADKCWYQLKSIMSTAKKRGYIRHNPIEFCAEIAIQNHNKELAKIRANLSKYNFTDAEEARILHYLCARSNPQDMPRCVKDSIWLLGLIRLFTGLSVREICALQWKHFQKLFSLEAYQLVIVQQLNNKGQPQSFGTYQSRKKLRKIPLAPFLAKILLERHSYLQSYYRYTPEELMQQPIILQTEPKQSARRKRKFAFCSLSAANKVAKTLQEEAAIPPNILSLLDGDNRFATNLNASPRDLFYTNFKVKASQICGMTEGQLCYITGTQPSDTLSAHYLDFSNDLMQYNMVCLLNRWSCIYVQESETAQNVPVQAEYRTQSIYREHFDVVAPCPSGIANLYLDLVPISTDIGELTVMIESEFGIDGSISVYPKGGL